MLLKRYSNIEYVLHLPLKRGLKLLQKAMEEDSKDYAFQLYKAKYPYMDKKNFISFNEFWKGVNPQKVVMDIRNEDEIMKEILEIENIFVKGGN